MELGCEKPSPARSDAKPAVTVSKPTWQSGALYTYDLNLTSELGVSAGEMVSIRLRADVQVEPRARSDGKWEFAFVLPNPYFDSADPSAREQFKALAAELAKPAAFSLVHGALSEVRLPRDFTQFAASITRTIAASFQFVPPVENSGDFWLADERDATGTYRAQYQRQDGRTSFSKKKVEYTELGLSMLSFGPLSAKLKPKVIASTGGVQLSVAPGGGDTLDLGHVESQETIETELAPGSVVSSKTRVTLALKGRKASTPTFDWSLLMASTRLLAATEPYATPGKRPNFDDTRIGDYSFDTALAELERQARDRSSSQVVGAVDDVTLDSEVEKTRTSNLLEQNRVFTAMVALFRKDPKNVEAASRHVRRRSPATRALFDAMASAGTKEAQAALVSAMEDEQLAKPARLAAAFSLGRTELATPEGVSALSRHVGPGFLQVHALYGLGTIARRLREAGFHERAGDIVGTLVSALEAAPTAAAKVHVLRGLANAGSPEALDEVKPYLQNRSDKVRAASIDAIRLMDHAEVDGIIAEALQDGDGLVQASALSAMAVRQPSDVLSGALAQTVRNAKKPETRARAVRVIRQWLPKRSDLRSTLEYVAANDPNERVRAAASAAL